MVLLAEAEAPQQAVAADTTTLFPLVDPTATGASEYRVEYITDSISDAAEVRFRQLADRWKRETAHLSITEKKAMHRDYQQIIGLGPLAIPLILTELEKSPGHWFWALTAIVGYTPVHQGHTGNIQQISEDWLEWGRQMGYLR